MIRRREDGGIGGWRLYWRSKILLQSILIVLGYSLSMIAIYRLLKLSAVARKSE